MAKKKSKKTRKPNLLVLMADSLRRDHLGCYGNEWIRSPNIDRLASESVVFDEAYPETLPTLPVRNAMLSGRHCGPELGWGPMREEDVRLPEIMRKRGYTAGLVADVYHMFKPGMNFSRGFSSWQFIRGQEGDPYKSAVNPDPPVPPEYGDKHDRRMHQFSKNVAGWESEEDYFTARVYNTATEWVEQNYRQGPFFLWVDSFDPHEPWYPPYYYADLYDPDFRGVEPIGSTYGKWATHLSPRQMQRMKALYAGEVTFLDRYIGKMLDTLELCGIADDTLVVLISDHGHVVGDHGLIGKGWATHARHEVMDLVLMIRYPGRKHGGKRVKALCYNIDVLPTVFGALGMKTPKQFEGIDMTGLVTRKKKAIRDCVTCSYHTPDNMIVKTLKWTLLLDKDHRPEMLFDRRKDPHENRNVLKKNPAVVKRLLKLEAADWAKRPPRTEARRFW